MTERPVSEVVADLRGSARARLSWPDEPYAAKLEREAAALLERLDTENTNLTEGLAHVVTQRVVAQDLLPTCPTCGGSGGGKVCQSSEPDACPGDFCDCPNACPDCTDGHVPLARLMALWEAVWDDGVLVTSGVWKRGDRQRLNGAQALTDHLRSVKP